MTIIKAIILGIIQGLTEFLPVSSSGHLVIFQNLLNFQEPGIVFEVIVHLGTMLAVVIYFRKDIGNLISSIFIWNQDRSDNIRFYQHLLFYLLLATIVTAILGFAFKNILESFFENILLVGFMLIITGLLLFISDKIVEKGKDITIFRALLIGFIQFIAIIPGISRSGSTISVGIFSGLNRDLSARFSFLLSIPAIFGAGILELKDIPQQTLSQSSLIPYLVSGLSAMVVGYLSISIFLKLIRQAKLFYFSVYCWIIAVFTIAYVIIL
ncbi:MAG: undecaprenyl-diphosphatase UppP [Candidatus Cloacimonadota bacterium]|nr:MAG: undecaprenyl-diphosphatase UppP [Candidatus Cloacimonadota bacterium]